jgi:succinate dehydrogenase / fumarate reductase, membrane anchor subunit
MDISETIAPASDQLDAVDLLSGPRTFTIESVSKGNAEQPVQIHLAEFARQRLTKANRREIPAAELLDAIVPQTDGDTRDVMAAHAVTDERVEIVLVDGRLPERGHDPWARAHGLGSAKSGVSHWWWQRLTAVALVPLTLWFVIALVSRISADHATVTAWLESPLVALLMILLIITTFHHGQLGMQVVIEDYVHSGWMKFASLIAVKFIAALATVASILAVLYVFLGFPYRYHASLALAVARLHLRYRVPDKQRLEWAIAQNVIADVVE